MSQSLLGVFTRSIHALQKWDSLKGLDFLNAAKKKKNKWLEFIFNKYIFSSWKKILTGTYQNIVKTHFRVETNCKVFKINLFKRVIWLALRTEWKRKDNLKPEPWDWHEIQVGMTNPYVPGKEEKRGIRVGDRGMPVLQASESEKSGQGKTPHQES